MTVEGVDGRPIEVLLVEDNPGDVRLTRKGLERGRILNNLHVAGDGLEALSFLRQEEGHEDAPRPDLVLLDLNMPRMDGHEFLTEVKTDKDLRRIPVVVLTSSEAEEDVVASYDKHANAYLTKPVGVEGFLGVVSSLEDFWLTVVKLPEE